MSTLDAGLINRLLETSGITGLENVDVFAQLDSTNIYLRDRQAPKPGSFRVALTDHQTAGRGRGANKWISAPGRSLCLSMAYAFRDTPRHLPSLTLALGVGIADTLIALGVRGLQLKWPNDILIGDSKLGGILTETQFKAGEPVVVVAGIGLNVLLPDRVDELLDSSYAARAIDLKSLLGEVPARESLAVAIIEGWCTTFRDFETGGFEVFKERYAALDWLVGRTLTVSTPQGEVRGQGSGVDPEGALLLQTSKGAATVVSGSITAVTH